MRVKWVAPDNWETTCDQSLFSPPRGREEQEGQVDPEGQEKAQEGEDWPVDPPEKLHKGGRVTLDHWEDELEGSVADTQGGWGQGTGPSVSGEEIEIEFEF